MKKIVLLILVFVGVCYGQDKNAFYLGGGLEFGNYVGLDASATFVYKNNYSFSLGRLGVLHETDNYPSDKDDTDSLPFNSIDGASHYYFSVGKILPFKKQERMRINLSLGVAKTKGTREFNFERREKTEYGYYYDSDFEEYNIFSFIINPRFEFVLENFSILHISPKVILNNKRNFFGINLGFMYNLTN